MGRIKLGDGCCPDLGCPCIAICLVTFETTMLVGSVGRGPCALDMHREEERAFEASSPICATEKATSSPVRRWDVRRAQALGALRLLHGGLARNHRELRRRPLERLPGLRATVEIGGH